MKKTILLSILCLSFLNFWGQKPAETEVESPEIIVQLQLDAYNARNIDEFVATYSEDIEIYNSKGELTMKGHEQLREVYERFFNNTPNLHCLIEKRIVINNKVIDKEKVTAGNKIIHAVALYEVADNKIKKVTFIDRYEESL